MAVAEAFDALTSAPNFDSADDIAEVMRNIMSRKGSEFDPVCVEALGCQLDTVGDVIATFSDPL